MIAATIRAKTGKNIETIAITIDEIDSTIPMTGLAKPAVEAVDVNLAPPTVPLIAAAVPPPAIIASAQVITGLKSETVETMTAVPAIVAKGTAMVSNKLSINGIK